VKKQSAVRGYEIFVAAGAAREFPQAFVDDYMRMVRACAEHDRTEIILRSTRMGFLTGMPAYFLSPIYKRQHVLRAKVSAGVL